MYKTSAALCCCCECQQLLRQKCDLCWCMVMLISSVTGVATREGGASTVLHIAQRTQSFRDESSNEKKGALAKLLFVMT
eukprot:6199112-Pleurochrysis_carterae.AAC.6